MLTSFDSVVLAAVGRDLVPLVGGKIVRVTQSAQDELMLDLRHDRRQASLLISIHARWARIHLTSLRASGERSPFALMLRHRLDRSVVRAIRQPPFERTLTLELDTDTGPIQLVAEIMGRHSNLILVEGGRIAGSLKPVPRSKSAVREVLPGRSFTPAPRDRATPLEITPDAFALLLQGVAPLAKALAGAVLGVSAPLAGELAARAGLDPQQPAPPHAAARLWPHLQELVDVMREQRFAPTVYLDRTRPVAFTPFPFVTLAHLTHHGTAQMSDAVDSVMTSAGATARREENRSRVLALIDVALEKLRRVQSEIERSKEASERAGELRAQGELLLAYASQIRAGTREAMVPGHDGRPVTIPLDPALSPIDNAQRLFRQYAKLRDAYTALVERTERVTTKRRSLEDTRTRVLAAATLDEIEEMRRELVADELVRPRGRRPAPSDARERAEPARRAGPRTFSLPGGSTVLVGRTNQENDRVTFTQAGPEDIWFHTRGTAGAHVILKPGGRRPKEAVIASAAAIAAYFSAARESGTVPVDYTLRKYVRKPKGAKPGVVTYEKEKTIFVKPELPQARKRASAEA